MTNAKAAKNYDAVKTCLETHEDARQDDNILCARIWREMGIISDPEYRFLRQLTERTKGVTAGAIGRARRKVQQDCPELQDADTSDARLLEEETYRHIYGGQNGKL